ncbi:MAG TPA: SDR family oxidoreductase [Hyphomonadaceae bacterium]|jgi:NAD(P)-dependent dehydrogenase (short-subunit alcohol dehydrogenase family)|nr:SDR family oxidoreductase [Hyphomonadaceae bacterium]
MAVALITGANRGIGLALVKAYAGRRDKVFAAVRRTSDRAELDAFVETQRKWVEVIEIDVNDPATIGKARRRLEAEPIDVLVNNAGVMGPDRQSATDMDYDGLMDALAVNSVAPLRIANAFLPNVKAAKGKIIALSSQMGSMQSASSDSLAYRVSKAALNRLMRGLAAELKPQGIPVLIVHPGWVKTEMGGEGATLSPEDSATQLLKLIDKLDISSTGRFLAWNGKELAW